MRKLTIPTCPGDKLCQNLTRSTFAPVWLPTEPPVSDICDRMVSTYTPWRENISMPKYLIKHSEIYGFDQMFMSARTSYRHIPKLAQVFAEYE